jgi:F0F1-type ATP synthase beta subunit
MIERTTLYERWWNFRRRIWTVRSAIELYVALGRRGRNGIDIYWSSLDAAERKIYVRLIYQAMHETWHKARSEAALMALAQDDIDFRPKP